MEWAEILREFGMPGLAILYLLYELDRKNRRIDELVDRQRDDNARSISAMERMSAILQTYVDSSTRRGGGNGS